MTSCNQVRRDGKPIPEARRDWRDVQDHVVAPGAGHFHQSIAADGVCVRSDRFFEGTEE